MGRLKYLRVENYRSIREQIRIRIPENTPLVLIGPNNAGKSNVARALDRIVGESWPGNHEPEDHEFFERDRRNSPIVIEVDVDDVLSTNQYGTSFIERFRWTYSPNDGTDIEVHSSEGRRWRPTNDLRGQCVGIYIEADRRLSYQMGYTSKYTLLSKLMNRFHQALTSDPARTARLQEKFSEVRSVFGEVDEFSGFISSMQRQMQEYSQGLEYDLEVDFSAYDPSKYFHALRIHPVQDGSPRSFDEIGTGQEQLLAFSFIQAYAEAFHDRESLVLIVEEPESHLHPLAQATLATKLNELVGAGIQVVITTHSPAFVDMLNAEGLVLVTKSNGATKVTQLNRERLAQYCRDHGAAAATAENILPFYSTAATDEILSGFFGKKVVLVEGPSESFALPTYLKRVGLDTAQEGVSVISVHGKSNISKWWRLFTAYGIPTYVIFDNDVRSYSSDPRDDILDSLGVSDSEKNRLRQALSVECTETVTVFGGDFEQSLRALFGLDYSELEQEAIANGLAGNNSKPLRARYVASRIAMARDSEAYQLFELLAQAIRRCQLPTQWPSSLQTATAASTAPPARQSPPRS